MGTSKGRGVRGPATAAALCLALGSAAPIAHAQTGQPRMAPAAAGLPPLPAVVRHEPAARQEARLKWFREARFGIFIHWGVYAVPAGTWKGRPVGAEWIMNQGKIPVVEYRPLARQFTAARYDPQAWAQLAADAGAKYVVITTKHHDGFALFDSAVTDWDAVDASGAKRDLIAPLVRAVRSRGLKFGAYYSQAQDWVHPGGATALIEPWDPAQRGDIDRYLTEIALPQTREIVAKFKPDILWWDTEFKMTPERARPFFDIVTSNPAMIHNSRLGGGVLGDFRTSEQRVPATAMLGRALEVNMTMNNSWGYRADDNNYKSVERLIQTLSDVASKDGNYLLNISPTAEGEIPAPQIERLQAIGRWMKVNGPAIHGTRGGLYRDPLPWGRATYKTAGGRTTLYAHVWEWTAGGRVLLPGVTRAPRSARLLASGAGAAARLTPQGLELDLAGWAPDPDVSVIELVFDGGLPITNPDLLPREDGGSGTLADPSKSP